MPNTYRIPKRYSFLPRFAFAVGLLLTVKADSSEIRPDSNIFMVIDQGTVLLGPDGKEIDRLSAKSSAAGALSPDGKWVVFSESTKSEPGAIWKGKMNIRSFASPEESMMVPLVWGTTGSSFLPIWSSDSKQLLICEQGFTDSVRAAACRIYDLAKKDITEFKLPQECWPSDWCKDGKRLLVGLNGRIAWFDIDGTSEPEFVTSELEVAYGGRLSPDGRRILCMAGPRRRGREYQNFRLSIYDLETQANKRTIVDEPGETHGYCWSQDGSRIAYTWQHSFNELADAAVRETFLMTCDPDGAQRMTVTSRKYQVPPNNSGADGTIIFFQILAWR